MAFTYDPTTAAGQVRLLAVDTDSAFAAFSDAEITAFLTLCNSEVRLAAALALDQRAARAAAVLGVTSFAGVDVQGHRMAEALAAQANELRRQVHEADDGSSTAPIAIAEWVLDPFSYREKLINEMLRQSAS